MVIKSTQQHELIYIHCLRNLSSSIRGRFDICVLFVLGGKSLLLDFHSWKKNIVSWCPRVLWHDVRKERDRDELSHVVSQGLGLQAHLQASCQGVSPAAACEPGHPALSTDGSLSLSRAPPLCFSHHPCSLPYVLIFCAHGHRTLRNQFTGKQGKAEN